MQGWYTPHDVILAWDAFVLGVQTEPSLVNASNYRHDIVDLTRQALQEIFHLLYNKLLVVYIEKNITAIGYSFILCFTNFSLMFPFCSTDGFIVLFLPEKLGTI